METAIAPRCLRYDRSLLQQQQQLTLSSAHSRGPWGPCPRDTPCTSSLAPAASNCFRRGASPLQAAVAKSGCVLRRGSKDGGVVCDGLYSTNSAFSCYALGSLCFCVYLWFGHHSYSPDQLAHYYTLGNLLDWTSPWSQASTIPPPPDKFLDMQLALNPTAPCKQSIKKTVETMHRGQNLFQHAIYIQTRRHRFKTCTPLRDDLYDLCRTDDIFPLQFTL